MGKELKVVAIKFDLKNEAQERYYEELLKLDDGMYTNIAAYAKAIVVKEMKARIASEMSEIELIAAKVAEIMESEKTSEVEEEGLYDEMLGGAGKVIEK